MRKWLIEIDESLTPETAEKKGYEWVKDTIYDPEAPQSALQDIIIFLKKGFKLGKPASRSTNTILQGLYKPLTN